MSRILLVEDDETLLTALIDWLVYEKHTVTSASTGADAWPLMQAQENDLYILDWDLPDATGIELLRRFRGNGGTVPVIMLTGRSSVDEKADGLDSGADDYLVKPFHVKELSARINAVLRKSERATVVHKALGVGNEEILKQGDLIGTSLSARYEFIDVIGSGAFGIVFKAKHPHLQKLFAIKMLMSQSEQDTSRFEREARAVSKFEHTNICAVHDFGITEKKRPFMVMDYVDGTDLGTLLKVRKSLSPREALDLVVQVADGMACAHNSEIIHRDLKPSNIMLKFGENSTVVKIVDFGCAKSKRAKTPRELELEKAIETEELVPAVGRNRPLETMAGMTVGTPVYMSPEQAKGREVDQRTDIYALGCILYELVSGKSPHVGDSEAEVMAKHICDDPEPLSVVCPGVRFPSELQNFLDKAMAKDPDERFQTMTDFKNSLETVRQSLQDGSGGWPMKLWEKLRQSILPLSKRQSADNAARD